MIKLTEPYPCINFITENAWLLGLRHHRTKRNKHYTICKRTLCEGMCGHRPWSKNLNEVFRVFSASVAKTKSLWHYSFPADFSTTVEMTGIKTSLLKNNNHLFYHQISGQCI